MTPRDSELLSRFYSGDKTAFRDIFEEYRPQVYGWIFRKCRNYHEADELLNDTFRRLYNALDRRSFRGDCAVLTYLCKIASNLTANRYYANLRRRVYSNISLDSEVQGTDGAEYHGAVSDESMLPNEEYELTERAWIVEKCLEKLDQPAREILQMLFKKGASYNEISEALNINVGTVKSRIARARHKLRIAMDCIEQGKERQEKERVGGRKPKKAAQAPVHRKRKLFVLPSPGEVYCNSCYKKTPFLVRVDYVTVSHVHLTQLDNNKKRRSSIRTFYYFYKKQEAQVESLPLKIEAITCV